MRRLSLVLACLAGMLVFTAQTKVRIRVVTGASGSPGLFTPSDLTYEGSASLDACSITFSFANGPMTGRHIGGEVHIFATDYQGGAEEHLIECKWNGLGYLNSLTLVRDWGPISQGAIGTAVAGQPCGAPFMVQGLLWDATLNAVFWGFNCSYNTTSNSLPNVGYTVLNDVAHTATVSGPWRMATISRKTEAYLMPLPASIQAALGGGKRIGSGAPQSAQNGLSPWGAFLTGWAPPSALTPMDTMADQTIHAITDQQMIYSDINTPQIKAGNTITCGWTHYGEHDILVTLSSGNGNLLSTSGAGSTTVVSAGTPFTPAMVGNNLYIEGDANGKFCAGSYQITARADSSHVTVNPSPTPTTGDICLAGATGGAGVGGFGSVGAEPQQNPTQDGTGCNVNGALCGVIANADAVPATFNSTDVMQSVVSVDGTLKKGIVYFGSILATIPGVNYGPVDPTHAHHWYGPTQVYPTGHFCPHGHNGAWGGTATGDASDQYVNVLYVYDPADILAVIAGSKTALSITQNYASTDASGMLSIAHGSSIQVNGSATGNNTGVSYPQFSNGAVPSRGAWFDQVDGKLYLIELLTVHTGCCYYGPSVHRFNVSS